jgi:hypothetical protein
MAEYVVKRQHLGDRMYLPGDTRQAAESEVGHLVKAGVLKKAPSGGGNQGSGKPSTTPGKGKAETAAPSNKAEAAAPKNKSA